MPQKRRTTTLPQNGLPETVQTLQHIFDKTRTIAREDHFARFLGSVQIHVGGNDEVAVSVRILERLQHAPKMFFSFRRLVYR